MGRLRARRLSDIWRPLCIGEYHCRSRPGRPLESDEYRPRSQSMFYSSLDTIAKLFSRCRPVLILRGRTLHWRDLELGIKIDSIDADEHHMIRALFPPSAFAETETSRVADMWTIASSIHYIFGKYCLYQQDAGARADQLHTPRSCVGFVTSRLIVLLLPERALSRLD